MDCCLNKLKKEYNDIKIDIDISKISRFDKYFTKRCFVLNKKYDIELNKLSCKCIRLYDSEDDYDIQTAPENSYYDNNENVWCIDMDEDEFNQTHEKYEYYKKIFIGEIITLLESNNNVHRFIDKHL